MKSGEKLVFKWVLAAILAIAALTTYLEIQHRGNHPPASATTKTDTHSPNQQADKAPVAAIPKGMIPEDLPDANARGATVLTLYCTQCHDLPTPYMHTANEWPAILQRMSRHTQDIRRGSGMMTHIMMPPEKDWKILQTYLSEHALTPIVVANYDDLDTAGGRSFLHMCSQCHEAPSPASHSRKQWPRIVLRMKSNMQAAHLDPPDQSTLTGIIDYLQLHSKAG